MFKLRSRCDNNAESVGQRGAGVFGNSFGVLEQVRIGTPGLLQLWDEAHSSFGDAQP